MDTLTVEITGSQLRLLQLFHDKYDKDHSLTYTFEECLVAGIDAKRRSKEYSEKTQNQKRFEKEIASDPSIVLHPDRMLKLMKKYRIGSSNEQLEEQVMEAAGKMQAEQEAEELKRLEAATAPVKAAA